MKKSNTEIKEVLHELERKNTEYAILRNYDFLIRDEVYSGGDVDILVLRKDLKSIKHVMESNNFKKRKLNPFSNHLGYQKYIPEDQKLLRFHFHINGVTGRHVTYLDADSLLDRKVKNKFFYHLSKEDELLVVLLHSLLDKSVLSDRYKEDIKRLLSNKLDLDYVGDKLLNTLPKEVTNKIISDLKSKRFENFNNLSISSKKAFARNNLLKIGYVYSFGALWKIFNLNVAPVVSLIGMDGAGKSTCIENIHSTLASEKIKHTIIYGGRGRNNILPIQMLGKIFSRVSNKDVKKQDPSSKTYTSTIPQKILYSFAAPVFALDLFLRYWVTIFPKRFFNDLVIVDRYSSDILLMHHTPLWIKRLLYVFLPKATRSIYLYNKPEVLFKRKKHPLADLIRQEKLFEKINKVLNPVKIKSETPEQTKKAVLDEVLSLI